MSSTGESTIETSRSQKFYGKYRGTVLNNIDPMQMGRIQVIVSDVSAVLPSSWAMPCVPVAGVQTGLFTVPEVGSGVWVEFEQGDPDYPIWVGGFWGSAEEVPALARLVPMPLMSLSFQTIGQNGIIISDLPGPTGGIMLKTATGASLTISDTGIYIQNGQGASITMIGPTITVNEGALTIV